jgi:hypothetical protein
MCPSKSADDRQAQPATGTEARVGVPEIMQAHAGQTRALGDRMPRALQIVARLLRIVAGYYVGADAHLDNDPLRRASEAIAGRIAAALDGNCQAHVVPMRARS